MTNEGYDYGENGPAILLKASPPGGHQPFIGHSGADWWRDTRADGGNNDELAWTPSLSSIGKIFIPRDLGAKY